jgi:hypothetical protein
MALLEILPVSSNTEHWLETQRENREKYDKIFDKHLEYTTLNKQQSSSEEEDN